jgi:hypothetical protein
VVVVREKTTFVASYVKKKNLLPIEKPLELRSVCTVKKPTNPGSPNRLRRDASFRCMLAVAVENAHPATGAPEGKMLGGEEALQDPGVNNQNKRAYYPGVSWP